MVDQEETPTIVIDNGSSTCRAGFAGDDEPTTVFSSILGKPRISSIVASDDYVGDEAQSKRDILTLRYPIERGIVTDWDDMEKIWHHAFDKGLRAKPADHRIMLTDAPLTPKTCREKMAQVMFEKFDAQAFHVVNHGVLSHYAAGRTVSLVLDIGDGVCDVVPMSNGFLIRPAMQRIDLAGRDLTEYMMSLLRDSGYSFATSGERELVREVKESVGYVAKDITVEMLPSSRAKKDFQLPSGDKISVGTERFRCAEPLFQPALLGRKDSGVHKLVYDSIMKCDMDLRKDFYCNIVLSGGTTMFEGFPERLEKEVSGLAPKAARVRVVARPERNNYVWIGGSILASLSTFDTMWISQKEYEEYGPNIVHRVCLN